MNERILDYLFYSRDGNAGERAAQAILGNKQGPVLKTIEKYDRGIKSAPDDRIKQEISKLKMQYLSKNKAYPSKLYYLKWYLLNLIKYQTKC
jgi:hypothetical protein